MYDITPVTSRRELDCGPTCLKMLLSYYGVDVDLKTLIKECGESVWGCTGADIMRAGRLHGLDMGAWRIDAEELVRQDRPAIVWWRKNHWCVLCGLDEDGKAVVCNPDRGRYRMSVESFTSLFAGVAITNGEPCDLPEEPTEIEVISDALAELSELVSEIIEGASNG